MFTCHSPLRGHRYHLYHSIEKALRFGSGNEHAHEFAHCCLNSETAIAYPMYCMEYWTGECRCLLFILFKPAPRSVIFLLKFIIPLCCWIILIITDVSFALMHEQ